MMKDYVVSSATRASAVVNSYQKSWDKTKKFKEQRKAV